MNRFLLTLVALLGCLQTAFAQTPAYQFLDDEAEPHVNISFAAKLPPDAAKRGSLTVVFDYRNSGSFYALDFAPGVARLRAVANGQSRVLSTAPIALSNLSRVTIQRRPWLMRVIVDNRVVLTGFDSSLDSGRIGIAATTGWYWQNPRVQPVDETVYFSDDFTRAADAATSGAGEWKPAAGRWELTSSSENITTRNIEMSANPFSYRVATPGAAAFVQTGRWYWDNYTAQVSVRPGAASPGKGSVGLAVYVRDARNYLALMWSGVEGPDARRLVRVVDGKPTVLARASGAYLPRQWYRLAVRTSPGVIEATIDGMPVFRLRDTTFGQGAIALIAENLATADWDDARVESYGFYVQDLTASGANVPWAGGAWTPIGGAWRTEKETLHSAPLRNDRGATRVVATGSADWNRYEIEAGGRTGTSGACGIVGGYRDDKNYTVYRWAGPQSKLPFRGRQQLLRFHQGKAVILSDEPATILARADANGFVRVRLRFATGTVTVFVGEEIVAQAADEAIAAGRPGLWSQGTVPAAFRDISLFFLPEPEKPKVAPKMEDDAQMVGWASPSGEWPPTMVRGRREFWNTGDFYGDTWIEVPWRRKAYAEGNLEIALRARREQFSSGYVLRCEPSPSAGYLKLTLSLGLTPNKPLKQIEVNLKELPVPAEAAVNAAPTPSPTGTPAPPEETPITLRIEVEGRAILVRAAGQPVFSYLTKPGEIVAEVSGPFNAQTCVAVRSSGFVVAPKELSATSAHRDDYTFTEAPIDWYAPQGSWSVFSRWPCYSDWSFFGGKGVAPVLWNKRVYRGDTVVEMYAHNQMDLPKEIGYSRAGDLNITIAADGKNPASGYSFIVAGWSNTRTRVYKGTQMVAENLTEKARFPRPINHNFGFHKRWFYIRAEVRQSRKDGVNGARIRLLVDDDLLAEYFDPEPLPALTNGGRVALWTVNSSIMVARAKIESAGMGGRVLPAGLLDHAPFSSTVVRSGDSGVVARPVESEGMASSLIEPAESGWLVRNPVNGDRFGISLRKASDEPWKVDREAQLEVDVVLPPGVKIDCYVTIDGAQHLITLTGTERPDARATLLGAATLPAASSTSSSEWRPVRFALGSALQKLYPEASSWNVESIVLGALHGDEYRWTGFNGNAMGAVYRVRNVRVGG